MQYSEKEKKKTGALRIALTASALVLTLAVLPNGAAASQTGDVQEDNVVIEGAPNTSTDVLPAAQTEGTDQPKSQAAAAQTDGAKTPSALSDTEAVDTTSEASSTSEPKENVITSTQPVDQDGNPLTTDMVEVVTPVQQPDKTAEVTVDEVTIQEGTDGEEQTSSAVTLKNVQDAVIQSTVDKLELLVSGFNTITSLKSTGSVSIAGSGLLLVDEIAVNGLTLEKTDYEIGQAGTAAVFYKDSATSYTLLNSAANPGILGGKFTLPEGFSFVVGDGAELRLISHPTSITQYGGISGMPSKTYISGEAGSLTVPDGSSLTVEGGGTLAVEENTISENNLSGSLPAKLTVNGDLNIESNANVTLQGRLTVGSTGTVSCNAVIDCQGTGTVYYSGKDSDLKVDKGTVYLYADSTAKNLAMGSSGKLYFQDGAAITGTLSGSTLSAWSTPNISNRLPVLKVGSCGISSANLTLHSGMIQSNSQLFRPLSTWESPGYIDNLQTTTYSSSLQMDNKIHLMKSVYPTKSAKKDINGQTFGPVSTEETGTSDIPSGFWNCTSFDALKNALGTDTKVDFFVFYYKEGTAVKTFFVNASSGDSVSLPSNSSVIRVEAHTFKFYSPIEGSIGTSSGSTVHNSGSGVLGGSIIHGGSQSVNLGDATNSTPEISFKNPPKVPEKPTEPTVPPTEPTTPPTDPTTPPTEPTTPPTDPTTPPTEPTTPPTDPTTPENPANPDEPQHLPEDPDPVTPHKPQTGVVIIPSEDASGNAAAKLDAQELKAQVTDGVETVAVTGEQGSVWLPADTAVHLAEGFLELRLEAGDQGHFWLIARNENGAIHRLGTGVTVRVAYDLPRGQKAENLRIRFIDNDGREQLLTCTYNAETGELIFTVSCTGSFTIEQA